MGNLRTSESAEPTWGITRLFQRRPHRAIVARWACTEPVRQDAYHIRYHGYLSHSHIKPDESESWSDQFDHAIYAPSIVIYDDNRPVGTVRLCTYDPAGPRSMSQALPSADLFDLTLNRVSGHFGISDRRPKIVEISKLAKLPEYESDFHITMALFKMLKLVVAALYADIIIVAVRAQHMNLYRRLGFEVAETPRLFTKDNVVLGLMACLPVQYRSIEERAEAMFRKPGTLKAEAGLHVAKLLLQGKPVDVFPDPVLKEKLRSFDDKSSWGWFKFA
jgi:hypothetical protein